ncbi:energy-coupling factor transporter transmembrane component T family protein [Adlercreutzia sp. ZJ141]|uniref:energy-coupling factor transporter transmembrane component T family protein n=1 Tax=Adlercreutzia sp. ZJ141 TaxID=2709406 RepID=UPI0013EA5E61|nr:energy-coupling factor transporter transmembrane component T [Adlercreutzia sp. ZJ141]
MDSVFSYIPGESFLHRMHPLTKLVAAFAVCVGAAVCGNHAYVLALIVAQLIVAAICGCFKPCAKLVTALGSLALIVLVLQVLCVRTGTPLVQAGWFMITDEGLLSGVLVVLKVVCMVLPLSIAFMTTQINDLTNELVGKWHLPYKYAFTVTTAIRFIPVFMDEMSAIMEAQKARGVRFDTGNVVKRIALMVPLCVPLLISSVKRTDAIAVAAELRGFNLRTRTSAWKKHAFALADFIMIVACFALFVVAIIL